MSRLSQIALHSNKGDSSGNQVPADIIEFVQSSWGLDLPLYPVQRVILKAHYGLPLDDNIHGFDLDYPIPTDHPNYDPSLVDVNGFYKLRVRVCSWRMNDIRYISEAGYLRYLHQQKRCNISEVVPGQERREMVLSVGRRSGKTMITSCIVAYETYKLLLKHNPQKFYGSTQSNIIQLISVATGRDQAGFLYKEASGHFSKCQFFKKYTANATLSHATFQTPYDIEQYGSYAENNKARYSINVTFSSCIAKGLRGGANILVALDEVAHFTDEGQSSADDVYQAVAPSTKTFSPKDPRDSTISLGENEGRIIMISSPLGRQGLFYKQFVKGFDGSKSSEQMLCIEAPTWEVNPTIPPDTFEADYNKDPRMFLTEFGAQFTDRTSGWIEDEADLMACVKPEARPRYRGIHRIPYYAGLDVGLVNDYTAIAIGHKNSHDEIELDLVESIKAGEGEYEGLDRLEFTDVVDWIYGWSKEFYIKKGLFDQYVGIPLEQALHAKGLQNFESYKPSPQQNSQMFRTFKDFMYDRRLVLYDWPLNSDGGHCLYIDEIMQLQAEVKSKYVTLVSAPDIAGKHDDHADALVRMVYLISQNMSTGPKHIIGNRTEVVRQHPEDTVRNMLLSRRKALMSGSSPDRMTPKSLQKVGPGILYRDPLSKRRK